MMQTAAFIANAKVMTKGQVTIPKDIRILLGLNCGDHVAFISDGSGSVKMVNSAFYAMQSFQKEMQNAAADSGLENEDDVMSLITELRREDRIE